jgi:hypothetical protein
MLINLEKKWNILNYLFHQDLYKSILYMFIAYLLWLFGISEIYIYLGL